jgi:Cys-tRNA(Pro) deacylase
MAKEKYPVTPAVRVLREQAVVFAGHLYPYEDKGGTAASSRHLGVDEHCVVKTLIMEDDGKTPLIILMHGDREVSTRELARAIGARSVSTCTPDTANRHSGYQVGGTSPFGTRRTMPVYLEESILDLDTIYINGGKRGFLVSLDPRELVRLLSPILVTVAIAGKGA